MTLSVVDRSSWNGHDGSLLIKLINITPNVVPAKKEYINSVSLMERMIIRKLWPILTASFLVLGIFAILGFFSVYASDDGIHIAEESPPIPRSPDQNLLFNPSFEGNYTAYIPQGGHPDCPAGICQTAQMAAGWTPFWRSHDSGDDPWIYRMPEYKPAELNIPPPPRVRTGERAQQYFTFYSTHAAGVYQRVSVEIGRQYCFSIWGHSWSSNDDNPFTSDNTLLQKVGIDPSGGTSWESSNIIWSSPKEQYNEYGQFYVCGTAQTNELTVFVFSEPIWAAKHNDVYWDDAELVVYEPELIIPQIDGISFVTDVDIPRTLSQEVVIEIPDDPWVSWSAAIANGGTLVPTLSATNGVAGDDIMVTVDSTGLGIGTHTADLIITSTPHLAGSPATVPVSLIVVQELHTTDLPYLTAP